MGRRENREGSKNQYDGYAGSKIRHRDRDDRDYQ